VDLKNSVRRRAAGAACVAIATVASLVVATPGAAKAPAPSDDIPGLGEIVHSPNLLQAAHVPKDDLFDHIFPNSDIAFQGRYAFAGSFQGFAVFDISRPREPRLVSKVLCPGGQNDISVYGNLLILSTDSSRTNDSCSSVNQSATIQESWEGIKIFDITDKANPVYVKSIETNCGAHTHTMVPGKGKDRGSVYVYVSSFFPDPTFPDCQPPHDLISIIKVPLRQPTAAAVVATPNLFPDGGNPPGGPSSETSGCHDITAFPAKDLAAGACMGDGILLDISRPEAPRVITRVRDTVNFAFWHSATFNNAGDKVVFTDELGGGVAAVCNAATGPHKGANAIYDIVGRGHGRKMVFKSYFKIPRANADTENCVAHNGSLIPVPGRDIMVQAWYQGGVSVWDFTKSDRPYEIGYWDRGPESATELLFGGSWSAYYYNGYIYSNGQIGLDVLKLTDPRTDSAERNRYRELNVQTQPVYGGRR
jgi:hypothetical protein